MAGFDPFANQGGPAAWDPDHRDDSRELADRLLDQVDDDAIQQELDATTESHDDPIADDPHFSPEFTD